MLWLSPTELPGTFTDILFRASSSDIRFFDDCAVSTNDARRDYWYGNYVLSRHGPGTNSFDRSRLESIWNSHVGGRPGVQKKIFQWEVPLGSQDRSREAAQQEFGVAPDSVSENVVLIGSRPNVAGTSDSNPVRPITTESQFALLKSAASADLKETPESPVTPDFLEWKYAEFWKALRTGQSTWWVAVDAAGNSVAQCGIAAAAGIGRYRDVITHVGARRKGFGRQLIAGTATTAFESGLCSMLVIVATSGSVAQRLYSSIGFQATTVQMAVHLDV